MASSMKSSRPFIQNFSINTIRGAEFIFQSPNSFDISGLINFFLDGLKKRSKYCVALSDYKAETPTALNLNQGDLIILEDGITGEQVMKSGWVTGKLDQTGDTGDIPTQSIYVLPTTIKPSSQILQLFTQDLHFDAMSNHYNGESGYGSRSGSPGFGTTGFESNHEKPHTLEGYSIDHFRPPTKNLTLKISSRKKSTEQLWKHSREPLKQPLLKKLLKERGLRKTKDG